MFPQLPEEMERMIWNMYFSRHVLKDVKTKVPIWRVPSNQLLYLCTDPGCLQHGHSDLERTLYHNSNWSRIKDIVYNECFYSLCPNCVIYGFPCTNTCYYGGFDSRLDCYWDMSHYNQFDIQYRELQDIAAEFI